MKEILHGIGYGNVLIDEKDIVVTSVDASQGLTECLFNIVNKMSSDMSDILKLPQEAIMTDYVEELGCNLMSSAIDAVLEKQYKKQGKVFKKLKTLTRIKIDELIKR